MFTAEFSLKNCPREFSVPIFESEPLDLKYLKRLPVIKIVEVKRHDDITGKAYKSRF